MNNKNLICKKREKNSTKMRLSRKKYKGTANKICTLFNQNAITKPAPNPKKELCIYKKSFVKIENNTQQNDALQIQNTKTEICERSKVFSASKKIVLIATMSALLIVGKFALAFVPNIEVVTTLIFIFAYVFGFYSLGATAIFCVTDALIYPTTPDVLISYFVYWNLLAFLASFFRARRLQSEIPYLILSLLMTIVFGIITSFAQSIVTKVPFAIVYSGGIIFFVLHFVSTLVFMSVAFRPLTKLLIRIKNKL